MDAVDQEGQDAGLLARGADHAHAGDVLQRARAVLQQRLLVGVDARESDALDIFDRRGQRDCAGDVGRAGLEALRRRREGGVVEGDGADHVAATLPRRHVAQQLGATVERADAGGAVELVAREGVEVAANRLHVHRLVGHGLGAIDQHERADRVRAPRHRGHRIDRAERVRHVGDRQQPGAFAEQALEGRHVELAVVLHRDHLEHRAGLLAHELPGHDVGVVLHGAEQDLVACGQARSAPALRHQVDRLGGAAGEHDLVGARGVEEALHRGACAVVELGGVLRQPVHAAVDVGVGLAVEARLGLDHRRRLLCGGAVVEVGEAAAMHRPRQDGEVGGEVQDGRLRAGIARSVHSSSSSRAPSGRRSSSAARPSARSGAWAMRSSTSAAKA